MLIDIHKFPFLFIKTSQLKHHRTLEESLLSHKSLLLLFCHIFLLIHV